MRDLGRIGGQGLVPLPVLFRNQPKDGGQLDQGLFTSRHERVTSGDGGYFGHPSIGLVSIQQYLVVIEPHRLIVTPAARRGGTLL